MLDEKVAKRTAAEKKASAFKVVPWLPEFYLDEKSVTESFNVVNQLDSWGPFSMFVWEESNPPRVACTVPPIEVMYFFSDGEIKGDLAKVREGDFSERGTLERMRCRAALLERRLNKRLAAFRHMDALIAEIAVVRGEYLKAIDRGRPPSARRTAQIALRTPGALCHLGSSLPTREMVEALRPHAPLLEFGAGFGLASRALEQAGIKVAATDPDSEGTGIAFPVHQIGIEQVMKDLKRRPLTLFCMWPRLNEGWLLTAFRKAAKGQVVAMASPEFEFVLQGLTPSRAEMLRQWSDGLKLKTLLARCFTEIARVPTASPGPGSQPVPIRIWRRN